jgi:hypothetical protein
MVVFNFQRGPPELYVTTPWISPLNLCNRSRASHTRLAVPSCLHTDPWCTMLFALMLLSGRAHATDSSKNQQPHIVMFVVDDLGWGDVGFHRAVPSREVQTPFMDSLVSTGIELTRYGARHDLHSWMPLVHTPAHLKRACVWPMAFLSGVSSPYRGSNDDVCT